MSQKKLREAYIRSRPLDGRAQICYTQKEWEERNQKRVTAATNMKVKSNFLRTLREAVDTIFPGAKDAGVTRFILISLRTVHQQDRQTYKDGVEQLDKLARSKFGKTFVNLSPKNRIHILQGVEGTEFFELLREHTMQGMFADPLYGGNQNMFGWKLIDYPGARFHPLDHTTRGWVTEDIVSLRGKVRRNNDKTI
ncbi:gluconate 2-dehydrogenase subunit 3 family protein [Ornithinibacillus salinisoli]|uniref:Gluconate 2-dehydrogenase subunit 3 family protein n=1 Tax=Ornithinibacillus salinisoli TaxID=1848459 RepID=A0ABW4VUT3_9BACI